eukprot:CAMPEP_0170511130 /NCGR_PEP_ID=MMETSP0208-20121228/66133_1 /TAXON_ID=197538 /ORGANISM="Strombidium inclinatum, Strain S3" /LENGTH=63 /DNA_ID=CAMNT_0010794637 /DNA_START=3215 /DNA_END=3406 /DNA_ORIENTATION=-
MNSHIGIAGSELHPSSGDDVSAGISNLEKFIGYTGQNPSDHSDDQQQMMNLDQLLEQVKNDHD